MAESKGSARDSLYARLGELQAMTPTDAVIARYCEDSFPHLALENLDEISAATGTSTASVTRFVRKLGYVSFRDFSRSLREEVAANFDLPDNAILLASVFDRHSRMVESVLRLFRQRNMTTVLLTNRSSTPMRRYADHVLLVSSESSTAFRSRACYLILLESLVAALAPEDHEVERSRVETMQGLFDELGVFITP